MEGSVSSPREQREVAPMTKRFAHIWDATFDRYGVIVDEKDLDRAFGALRSYYEYKIREMYDRDFKWDECRKNNFALRENAGNFTRLPDLVSHMREEGLVPRLMFDNISGYIIKRINEGGEVNVKPSTTLWDLHEDAHLLKLILDVPFSLHSRKPIPLGALCGDSANVLNTIKLADIFRRTSENDRCVNVVTWTKKLLDYRIEQNCLLVKQNAKPLSRSKTLQGFRLIPAKARADKFKPLDCIASLLSLKCLVIKCDLRDCVNDFKTDKGEIDENPIRYFYNKFREKEGSDANRSILDAIYEKHINDGQVIIIFDSFERFLFGKFATKVMAVLKEMKEISTVSLLVTIHYYKIVYKLQEKFPHLQAFSLHEFYRNDIRDYLKVNGITVGEEYKETLLGDPLQLSMVKEICNENIMRIKVRLTKISDLYSEFIKHCMVTEGRNIDLLTHMALTYIFPEKHLNVRVNFDDQFPHKRIAEYLVAMWFCDPKNSNRVQEFLPIVFSSYKYNGVYNLLLSDWQSSKNDLWRSVPQFVSRVVTCIHSNNNWLKSAVHVIPMLFAMDADTFKSTLCPFVDLNGIQFQYGDRFLHVASRYRIENLVKILLKIGSEDVNCKNDFGRTPLHHSCLNGDGLITKCLLDYGADPNLSDENGDTPLHVACVKATNPEVVKILLENKADPNVKSPRNVKSSPRSVKSVTNLQRAKTSKYNTDFATKWLEWGPSRSPYNRWPYVFLDFDDQKNTPKLVKLLIDYGAKPD